MKNKRVRPLHLHHHHHHPGRLWKGAWAAGTSAESQACIWDTIICILLIPPGYSPLDGCSAGPPCHCCHAKEAGSGRHWALWPAGKGTVVPGEPGWVTDMHTLQPSPVPAVWSGPWLCAASLSHVAGLAAPICASKVSPREKPVAGKHPPQAPV